MQNRNQTNRNSDIYFGLHVFNEIVITDISNILTMHPINYNYIKLIDQKCVF